MTTLRKPKIRFEDTILQTTNHPTCLSFIKFKSINIIFDRDSITKNNFANFK